MDARSKTEFLSKAKQQYLQEVNRRQKSRQQMKIELKKPFSEIDPKIINFYNNWTIHFTDYHPLK